MSAAQPIPEPRYTAVCRVCHQTVTEYPPLDIPIIGQPNAKAEKVLMIMGTHIAKKHPEQFGAGISMVKDFQAFLIVSQFVVDDPTMQHRFDLIRAGVQALSRKFFFTDQHITQAVTQLDSAGQLSAENVTALIREMRDVLSEQGRYAPAAKPEPQLVTP